MEGYICDCGAVFKKRLELCPRCLRSGSFRPNVSVPNRVISAAKSDIISGKDIINRGNALHRAPGVWKNFFPEGMERPFFMVMWGLPGSWKSTTCLRLAHDWPSKAIYMSTEMGVGISIQSIMARHELYDFDVSAPINWDVLRSSAEGYDLVIIDSMQHLRLDPAIIRSEFLNKNVSVIGISQTNSAGETRGGIAAQHESDISVNLLEAGKYRVLKTRFGDIFEGDLNDMCNVS